MPNQVLLHSDFGDNIDQLSERQFERRPINQEVKHDRRYIETIPTMWASAYELRRTVEEYGAGGDDNLKNVPKEFHEAVEEWTCLFLLYYFGVANLEELAGDVFVDNPQRKSGYDPDLWPALSLTYPEGDLRRLTLLRVDDQQQTVIGACYPGIIFFPSRGRQTWLASEKLNDYLANGRLSWAKCAAKLLDKTEARTDFLQFLASVKGTLKGANLQTAVALFCAQRRLALPANAQPFPSEEPGDWARAIVTNTEVIMQHYPLVRNRQVADPRTGNPSYVERTYFIAAKLSGEAGGGAGSAGAGRLDGPWMGENVAKGMPTPRDIQAERTKVDRVVINWGGQRRVYVLQEDGIGPRQVNNVPLRERVVLLEECFLPRAAYWCRLPAEEGFATRIQPFHLRKVGDQSPELRKRSNNSTTAHLAPVNKLFMEHFGFDLYRPDAATSLPVRDVRCEAKDIPEEGRSMLGARWTFAVETSAPVPGGDPGRRQLEISWEAPIEQNPKLEYNTAAIYPPEVSKDWRLYVSRGYGATRNESGIWGLVDENGRCGEVQVKGESESISVLTNSTDNRPNRPQALMLYDADNNPRGAFFLENPGEKTPSWDARLGVDFGTSNTCLAFQKISEPPPDLQTLKFQLSPRMIWGRASSELPGFVPFAWQGKDFFSTVLLSTKAMTAALARLQPHEIKPADLFLHIDIPVLHKGLQEALALGVFENDWIIHPYLKWEQGGGVDGRQKPWRALFLSLSLLYAHAELFFKHDSKIKHFVFTFPLAFDAGVERDYEEDVTEICRLVRSFCYPGGDQGATVQVVDESTAVAASQGIDDDHAHTDVFIDIGGMTTDIAVRADRNQFYARDSVKVAGSAFFKFIDGHRVRERLDSAKYLNKHLGALLKEDASSLSIPDKELLSQIGGFGSYFSIAIGERDQSQLERSMREVRRDANPEHYQTFRSRLFYEHLLAYALLQACAAIIKNPTAPTSIRVICTGNAWGLLTFAKLEKSEQDIRAAAAKRLERIKQSLKKAEGLSDAAARLQSIDIGPVIVVGNQRDSGAVAAVNGAKTAVASGAIKWLSNGGANERTGDYYSGLRLGQAKAAGIEVKVGWSDVWSVSHFSQAVGQALADQEIDFDGNITDITFSVDQEAVEPFDPLLYVFMPKPAALTNGGDEKVKAEIADWLKRTWRTLNGKLLTSRYTVTNDRLPPSPLNRFLGEVIYEDPSFLDELAERNNKK